MLSKVKAGRNSGKQSLSEKMEAIYSLIDIGKISLSALASNLFLGQKAVTSFWVSWESRIFLRDSYLISARRDGSVIGGHEWGEFF